ncbi:hypothetical protein ACFCX0_01925 [Streptomyces sp. NPDC056352]|uniref:hypothetical protein n=1 Tax=Streptomyces sp. NPDC056352 TaxID=3345791 RepID=UPI0035DE88FA
MHTLKADTGPAVRRELAHNPRLSLDLLGRLASCVKVGATVLRRIATASLSEVARLAASSDPAVRTLAAARRDLLPEIRDALAADRDAKALKNMAPHPGLIGAQLRIMVERHGDRVAVSVAANPGTSPGLLEDLTRWLSLGRKLPRVVARHPAAPAGALDACADDQRVRPPAARHPNVPTRTIVRLLADDWQVVEAAAANPSPSIGGREKQLP